MTSATEEGIDRLPKESTHDSALVYERELDEIVHRRKVALDRKESPQEIRQNLVGLALSGGGVRSSAIGLGVLQSFYNRRILPFVDYLSTVSGGGYAGAYLSSVALKASRKRKQRGAKKSDVGQQRSNSKEDDVDELFPIAHKPTGQSPTRMLQFIHGGDYLGKTWVFFNRYLIGLFAIWAVVISGVVAATSLAAWLFRCLDHTQPRAWATALGFDDDIELAFLPSFVLLFLWIFLWAVSYFKFTARCTGFFARGVFYVLVAVTLVAIAALLGNGEYGLPGLAPGEDETLGTVSKVIYTVILTTLVAALLPYLKPTRLAQSGTAPKNTVEKYIFWVATRALAFGVPFVLVAFFARENISNWNERRDDRLTRIEVAFELDSPLWRQVAHEIPLEIPDLYKALLPELADLSADTSLKEIPEDRRQELKDKFTGLKPMHDENEFKQWLGNVRAAYNNVARDAAKANASRTDVERMRKLNRDLLTAYFQDRDISPQLGDMWPLTSDPQDSQGSEHQVHDLQRLARLFKKLHLTDLKDKLAASDLDKLNDLATDRKNLDDLRKVEEARVTMAPDEFAAWRKEQLQEGGLSPELFGDAEAAADPDKFVGDWDEIQAHVTESTPMSDPTSETALSFSARWWHLLQYVGEAVTDTQKAQENVIYRMANSYVHQRELKWYIVGLLNKRLEDPYFFRTLLPEDYFGSEILDRLQSEKAPGESAKLRIVRDAFSQVAPYHATPTQTPADTQRTSEKPDDAFRKWFANLRALRFEAERLAGQLVDQATMDTGVRQDDLQDERATDAISISQSERARATIAMNRKLLQAYYGNLITDKEIVYSSVVLAEDQRIRWRWFLFSFGVATGIASIYARDAMAMAAGHQTLTEAFGDRFVLGLGVSHQSMVEGIRGHRYDKPYSSMVAYLEAMDGAVYVGSTPATSPRRVLGALGPKMLALSVSHGDGAHPYNVTPEHTFAAREILGPDGWLAPEQAVILETDPDVARAAGRAHLAIYLGLPNYTDNLKRLGFEDSDFADGGSDRLIDRVVPWGDETAVAAAVAAHHDAGADHVCVQVVVPDGSTPLPQWRALAPALLG